MLNGKTVGAPERVSRDASRNRRRRRAAGGLESRPLLSTRARLGEKENTCIFCTCTSVYRVTLKRHQ